MSQKITKKYLVRKLRGKISKIRFVKTTINLRRIHVRSRKKSQIDWKISI